MQGGRIINRSVSGSGKSLSLSRCNNYLCYYSAVACVGATCTAAPRCRPGSCRCYLMCYPVGSGDCINKTCFCSALFQSAWAPDPSLLRAQLQSLIRPFHQSRSQQHTGKPSELKCTSVNTCCPRCVKTFYHPAAEKKITPEVWLMTLASGQCLSLVWRPGFWWPIKNFSFGFY